MRALVREEQQDILPGVEYVTGNFDDEGSLRTSLAGVKRAFLVLIGLGIFEPVEVLVFGKIR